MFGKGPRQPGRICRVGRFLPLFVLRIQRKVSSLQPPLPPLTTEEGHAEGPAYGIQAGRLPEP